MGATTDAPNISTEKHYLIIMLNLCESCQTWSQSLHGLLEGVSVSGEVPKSGLSVHLVSTVYPGDPAI